MSTSIPRGSSVTCWTPRRCATRPRRLYESACAKSGKTPETLTGPAAWQPAADPNGLVRQGEDVSIVNRQTQFGDDVTGLQELILYGIKGAAAYADHARILDYEDADVYATFHEALNFLTLENPTTDQLLGWVLRAGELNLTVMGLLDAANTSTYGHPEPTKVRVTPVRGKCIVVSGHDLKDLEELLKQTEGRGINVYTHGEMLPCHAYPGLKKYPHLVGNYGGAWQDQRIEFETFPGAILMTTNCIQKPKESYLHRIFTSGLVAWPCVRHIGPDRDFSPVIEAALAADGFAEDAPEQTITVGFGHHAVLGVADKVVAAVKNKQIRHFFLVGGCDGAKPGPQLLHRLRPKGAERLRDSYPGLRQVPLQQAGVRLDRRRAAAVGHRPVQRRLLGDQDRHGPGRGLPLRSEPTAAVLDHQLVRAEGGGHSADALIPGHQEHPAGAELAGVRIAVRARGVGRQVRHRADQHAGGRSGGHFGIVVTPKWGVGRGKKGKGGNGKEQQRQRLRRQEINRSFFPFFPFPFFH